MATTSTIAQLAPQTQDRLQDPSGIFWLTQYESYAALAEAITELFLIIGRPTQVFNIPFSPVVNTVWNSLPTNFLAVTDLYINGKRLAKTTLRALDYLCSSWSSSWESDRAASPQRWAPVGLNLLVLHPAPLVPITLTATGLQYPILTPWPPSGTETSPFHKEADQALQLFAASYCRVKEAGDDFLVGQALYQQFLEIGQRLSQIEDRRDSLVWTRSIGVPTAPSQVSHR